MIEYTEQEFLKLINSQNNINFIAEAVTPWHVLGVEAAVYQMQRRGIHLKGYIICEAHPVTGLGINEKSFLNKTSEELQIVTFNSKTTSRKIREKINKKINKYSYYLFGNQCEETAEILYWVKPLSPAYDYLPIIDSKKRNVITVLIDEGLGTYLTSPVSWIKTIFREESKLKAVRSIVTILISNRYFFRKLQHRKQIQYNQLLIKNDGRWIPNQSAIDCYKTILNMRRCENDYLEYRNAAIINIGLTNSIYKNTADVYTLKEVCEELRKKNISIILKPHPRDEETKRFDILGCTIERRKNIAQEVIFASLEERPLCVIGFDSTTLVSAKLLFDINTISLNKLCNQEELYDKNRMKRFNNLFSNIVRIPRNKKELIDILEEIEE